MALDTPILTAEAARIIGVTPAAVRQMEKRGALPSVRTESGVRLFERADVQRLADSRKHQGASGQDAA